MQTHILPQPPTEISKIVTELKYWKALQYYSGFLPEKDFSLPSGGFIFYKLASVFS